MMTLTEIERLRLLFDRLDRGEPMTIEERLEFSNLVDAARTLRAFPLQVLAYLTELSVYSLMMGKRELAALSAGMPEIESVNER